MIIRPKHCHLKNSPPPPAPLPDLGVPLLCHTGVSGFSAGAAKYPQIERPSYLAFLAVVWETYDLEALSMAMDNPSLAFLKNDREFVCSPSGRGSTSRLVNFNSAYLLSSILVSILSAFISLFRSDSPNFTVVSVKSFKLFTSWSPSSYVTNLIYCWSPKGSLLGAVKGGKHGFARTLLCKGDMVASC